MRMFRTAFACVLAVMSFGMVTESASAQVTTYRFTGTRISATEGVGESISGTVTLDTAAAPDLFGDFPEGQFAQWQNGRFTVNAVTNTGFAAGSSLGGTTFFDVQDIPVVPIVEASIESRFDNGQNQRSIRIDSRSHLAGDGLVSVPNPWNPLLFEERFIYVSDFEYSTGNFVFGQYSIDTFEIVIPTIVIDGIDTGIQDFVYGGILLSKRLSDIAASAKNHGAYVSGVTKLTNTLRNAGLITDAQRSTILQIVVHSR